MKSIGTITFHASYNHGSCLQAYALQRFILDKFGEFFTYNIINYRTNIQKEMYRSPFDSYGVKSLFKRLIFLKYKNAFKTRAKSYEDFILNYLNITKECNSVEDILRYNFNFDIYLAGSDQLWNLNAYDFDWANFLNFVDNKRKISYAASFGPSKQNWSDDEFLKIRKLLGEFECISVREEGSANNIEKLLKFKPLIHVDPTMLLTSDEWKKLIGNRIINEKYIFLYDVKGLKDSFELAKLLSKHLDLPVVIVKENVRYHIMYNFIKKYDSGPLEFLNYINYADLILSSSFHGTVFSIILKKPFFAINGDTDFRINNLLKKFNLEKRFISLNSFDDKINEIFDLCFDNVDEVLELERKKSYDYLYSALLGETNEKNE